MEQSQYLIDTNAIIDYLGQKLPPAGVEFMNPIVDNVPNVSVISKIEVLGFNASEQHYQLFFDFMYDSIVLDLTSPIVDVCIVFVRKIKRNCPMLLLLLLLLCTTWF